MVLLILALAGLNLVRPTRELFVVFAVDRSQSIGEEGSQAVDAFLEKAAPLGGHQPFRHAALRLPSRAAFATASTPSMRSRSRGCGIRLEESRRPRKSDPEPTDAKGLDRKGTDLAAALEVAAAAIPPFYVPRIVLLSDGNATTRRRRSKRPRRCGARSRSSRSRCRSAPIPRSSSRP